MQIDATGSEVLDDHTCLQLLRHTSVGRVALTRDALPVILPVAFGLLGSDLVIRAGAGAVFHAGQRGSVLCFEADITAPDWTSGWSVVVIGRAELLADHDELVTARSLDLPDWRLDPSGADAFVRIHPELISGRRFARPTAVTVAATCPGQVGATLGV